MTSLPNAAATDVIIEDVVYQNPLLFLKIWEIRSEPSDSLSMEQPPAPMKWHYHKEVELLVMLEGRLGVQTQDDYTVLGPGDVYTLGSSQLHRTQRASAEELRYVVFQVDLTRHIDQSTLPYLSAFSELTEPLSRLNYIWVENARARQDAFALVMTIFREAQARGRGYELAVSAAIKQLLLLFIRSDTRSLLGYGAQDAELVRLQPALDYIDRHLTEKLTVEDVCELVHLSYHYFIKRFHKVIGLSFVDYVNYKRIKTAERLLLTQDLSIAEIGERVGIPNMAQFYKLFKRHNQCSPRTFKQRMQGEA
ncbi:AraC family transcriptional regulator [Paenibacillus sp. YYML68]|uniref:helix-turn-helix domain-containing protein n=1 Tax=Paenibacillus sp. YYML68 TaxID=2909250 RepID=UPI00248FE401|nr:helix-turn-helix domain-containing protein [Paenibacillus sp. YYML68]